MSTVRRLFGVDLIDFKSWSNFVKMMNRPEDPSSLAIIRMLFGIDLIIFNKFIGIFFSSFVGVLMILDIPQERGMAHADVYYPNENMDCQFPLFNFLKPLRAEHMVVVFTIMLLGKEWIE